MLESARPRAIDVLDQRLFVLDAGKYDALVSMLDNSRSTGPTIKALMKRRPLWERVGRSEA